MNERYKQPTEDINAPSSEDLTYLACTDIFSERQSATEVTNEIRARAEALTESIAALDPEERERAEDNLTLLKTLSGHRGTPLRRRMRESATPEAAHLAELYAWSKDAAENDANIVDALCSPPPPLLAEVSMPDSVYERLTFVGKYPDIERRQYDQIVAEQTAAAIGAKPEHTKWIDLIGPAFDPKRVDETIPSLIEKVGFIPTDLLTKKKFNGLGGEAVVGAIDVVRQIPNAVPERAKLTNYLFRSKNAETIRPKGERAVTLDQNGIFINLKGFHSHLPYGLIEDATVAELLKGNWIASEMADEILIRQREANFSVMNLAERKVAQLQHFAGEMGLSIEASPRENLATLADWMVKNPDAFARDLATSQCVIPDALVEAVLGQGHRGSFAVVETGEAIGAEILGKVLARQPNTFTHALLRETRESYAERASIINHPGFYSVNKITGSMLRQGISSNPDARFAVLRGRYRTTRDGQHSFIEAIHDGNIARILVDEGKFAGENMRRHLSELPSYDKEQYDDLERALVTFENFTLAASKARSALAQWQANESGESDEEWNAAHRAFLQVRKSCETGLHFLQTNVTPRYREAKEIYNLSLTEWADAKDGYPQIVINVQEAERLFALFDEARSQYGKFLYRAIGNPVNFLEEFTPEIRKDEVVFGPEFLQGAQEQIGSGKFDENLSLNAPAVRTVILNYKPDDPSETVPFHIEEAALDALRLNRGRALINIIGGAKFLESSDLDTDPYAAITESIMRLAHKYRANVAVPGTQSGIGIHFGRANANYREVYGSLPHRDQAHVFSISPGRSVYAPGNPHFALGDPRHAYALTPVDTILTPADAGWGLKGLAKIQSPYRTHIDYMEGLYRRVSDPDRRITIIANGGMYSVMEATEAYRNGFTMIYIYDSGRFAEAVPALYPYSTFSESIDTSRPMKEVSAEILERLRRRMRPEAFEEFLEKDFGRELEPESEKYEAYRKVFFEFLQECQRNFVPEEGVGRMVSFQQLARTLDIKLMQKDIPLDDSEEDDASA
jgi:hypothetical protein